VVNDAELVPEEVTVDIVVEAAVMELVMLPLEFDMEPVELDTTVPLVVVPETEAADEGAEDADEEATVVESIANWPE